MYLNAAHEVGTITGSTITLSGTEVAGGQTFATAGATVGPVYTVRVSALSDSTTWAVCLATYSTGSLAITETIESSGSFGAGTPVSVFSTIRASVLENVDLSAIAGSLSATAVDLFLYDTSEDDDPNWINDASKSWYTETLNTATRGLTRPFPRLALLVLEASKLTIYDATDPALPMWMVFNGSAGNSMYYASGQNLSCVAAKNGLVYVGNGTYDIYPQDFVLDTAFRYRDAGKAQYLGNMSERNASKGHSPAIAPGLVNRAVNDIALTVLPDTPVDPIRNMRTPTVAVATDGGVSVIHADGTVADITGDSGATYSYAEGVAFIGSDITFGMDASSVLGRRTQFRVPIPSADRTVVSSSSVATDKDASSAGSLPHPLGNSGYCHRLGNDFFATTGLSRLAEFPDDPLNAAIAYITSTYNTGWMQGAIKGAWLSDTTAETVGVDESTELVTNGDFSSWSGDNPTDWIVFGEDANNYITEHASGARIVSDGSATLVMQCQAVTTDQPTTFAITKSNHVSGSIRFRLFSVPSNTDIVAIGNIPGSDANGTFYTPVYKPVAGDTGLVFQIYRDNLTNTDYVIESVRHVTSGNLIENGEFTYSTTGWTGTNATLSVASSALRVTAVTGGEAQAYQAFTAVVGQTYVVSAQVVADASTANPALRIGTSAGGGQLVNQVTAAGASYTFTFTATATTLYVSLVSGGATLAGEYVEFDNISVRLADPDRSVNAKGLEVHGQLTKTAVATGADLVAYSGFSATDYLEQPYNSDLDFGTGDFHVMGWVKGITAWDTLICRAVSETTNSLQVGTDASNQLRVFLGSSTYYVAWPLPSSGQWHHLSLLRRSGVLYAYLNGVETGTASGTDSVTVSNSTLRVGLSHSPLAGLDPLAGSISLLRIGASAPTAAQIAAFYADEKPLFQAGAKCTLPGSSDVVNALAYNRWLNTLHVGTGAGKATFKGLVNVSEDTTAAVTKIAALGDYEATD